MLEQINVNSDTRTAWIGYRSPICKRFVPFISYHSNHTPMKCVPYFHIDLTSTFFCSESQATFNLHGIAVSVTL